MANLAVVIKTFISFWIPNICVQNIALKAYVKACKKTKQTKEDDHCYSVPSVRTLGYDRNCVRSEFIRSVVFFLKV